VKVKSLLVPGQKWLPTEVGSDGHDPADNFAALHCQVDLTATLVSQHHLELDPHCLLENFGNHIPGVCPPGRTALGWRSGLLDVIHILKRSVRTNVKDVRGTLRTTDPSKFTPVVPYLFVTCDLIKVEIFIDRPKGQAIWLCETINIVGCNPGACTWHILDDEVGLSRDELRHEASHMARPSVVESARGKPHYYSDGLPLIKGFRLGPDFSSCQGTPSEEKREGWGLSVLLTSAGWFLYWGLFDQILHLPFPEGKVFFWMGL